MPFRRRFKKRVNKRSTKHSGTIMANTGPASTVAKLVILKTSGGPRSTDGSPQTIQSFASTDDDCKTGDEVKFTNLHIQAGPRVDINGLVNRIGWVEWAFVLVRENETEVPNTRIGVQTLGDICTNMYRGECIYTGAFPIGVQQSASTEIKLRIPKSKRKIKLGDEWRFLTYYRTVLSTDTTTDSLRLIKSYNHIVYS